MKLEVVVVPVSDVDRARDFYTRLGWRLDADLATDEKFRVVQVTPPGSPASVIFGSSVTDQAPGSAQGLHLIVSDINAAHDELKRLGAEPSEVFHDEGGVFHHAGTEARVPGPHPQRNSYGSFLSFSDPDGNGWVLQEITTRLPGRLDTEATTFSSVGDLADALRRAAAAEGGAAGTANDQDWPERYARFLAGEQAGTELPA
ncbi:VOC family protein [Streptomyces sp. Act143]|uniref:VOC family protein n=1 Tax=Streptomyces sp. Act143 TaxID=2200760 RepID=UPI0028161D58|nr:VOC family protein [Streptomyces sp. Act143]